MRHKGIDYGLGQTNINKETRIRFGVISQHALSSWALDGFESDYGDASCPECGNAAVASDEGETDRSGYKEIRRGREFSCDSCEIKFDGDCAFPDEPIGNHYDADGYVAEMHGDGDIFVLKSPYYTRAQFCSPCAPGACHLGHPMPEGEKCYCFGHDWFETNVAPYPVFRVDNDEEVLPTPQ